MLATSLASKPNKNFKMNNVSGVKYVAVARKKVNLHGKNVTHVMS